MSESKQCVVLHVTDFHLANIGSGSREFLRMGYYDEYLRNMWEKMSQHLPQSVDLIVATGDYVDRGKVDHFTHARDVLMKLAQLAGVDESRVAICIGNHDIDRARDRAGEHDVAREAYYNFAKQFSLGKVVHTSHRGSLLQYENGIHCVMLDGTWGASNPDVPAMMEMDDTDHLVNDFLKLVPDDEILVIGSHYPIAPFPDDFAIRAEGPDYVERHFWTSAIPFKRRVAALRKKAPTLWLFGDVHNSDAYSESTHCHVITGRLGVRVPVQPAAESQRPRQCRAVVLAWNDEVTCDIVTGNFVLTTHVPQPEIGDWIVEACPIRRTKMISSAPKEQMTERAAQTIQSSHTHETTSQPSHSISVLDHNLNSAIYDKVQKAALCRMGRFRTNGDTDSLAWVSIGPLLGAGEYLSRFCGASLSWLVKTYNVRPYVNGESVLFLGIDCWGASIATILATACGSKALCVAVRAEGRFHTVGELLDDVVLEAIANAETVVIVTDVIATGCSIESFYYKIKSVRPESIRAEQQWIALAVLMDANRQFLERCPFLAGIGIGCIDIKLPSIPSNLLPGDDIAPASVSFA